MLISDAIRSDDVLCVVTVLFPLVTSTAVTDRPSPLSLSPAVPLARSGSQRPSGASYTYHSGPAGGRSGGPGRWGAPPPAAPGGYRPQPSAPPGYGWSVPPHDGPAAEDDADLAEAIRRPRQTYSEEAAARRRFEPSAPPL